MAQITEAPPSVEYFPSADCWVEERGKVILLGSHCPSCGKYVFPRRTWCDACETDIEMEPARLSGTGTLYSFSEIHVAPGVFKTPYVIGYVDLPENVRILAQIEHPAAELEPGDAVQVVLGVIRTSTNGEPVISYKFRKIVGTKHA